MANQIMSVNVKSDEYLHYDVETRTTQGLSVKRKTVSGRKNTQFRQEIFLQAVRGKVTDKFWNERA